MSPENRPDPLAPPERLGRRGGPPPGPDLSVCSEIVDRDGTHCDVSPVVVVWIGCTRGEHAGPMAGCTRHAAQLLSTALSCAQCRARCKVFKVTGLDGTEVETFAGQALYPVPEDVWKRVTG